MRLRENQAQKNNETVYLESKFGADSKNHNEKHIGRS